MSPAELCRELAHLLGKPHLAEFPEDLMARLRDRLDEVGSLEAALSEAHDESDRLRGRLNEVRALCGR